MSMGRLASGRRMFSAGVSFMTALFALSVACASSPFTPRFLASPSFNWRARPRLTTRVSLESRGAYSVEKKTFVGALDGAFQPVANNAFGYVLTLTRNTTTQLPLKLLGVFKCTDYQR